MLLRDALLAYAHFLAILFLTAVLCAELAVYRQELAAPMARRLQRIDLFFGIAALLVIVTGIARVVFGLKGADVMKFIYNDKAHRAVPEDVRRYVDAIKTKIISGEIHTLAT